jgi:Transposase DDE domain
MSSEALLAAGYATCLVSFALALEWLSAHTHRRALRYRTAGFEYHADHDVWVCPEGEHLWPHEFDHERRLVRYRARAHVCNGCPVKERCTDSEDGREVVRPLDPWPHSEAGRFHRVVALMLVALAALVLLVGIVRNHSASEVAGLGALVILCAIALRLLLHDLRGHPANFPDPTSSHGLRMTVTGADGRRRSSRWPSQTGAPRGP